MVQVSMSTAYMWAIIVLVVFELIAVLIANAIPYRPNNTGATARKLWFWILAILTPIVGYLINFFAVSSNISAPTIRSEFQTNMAIAAGVAFVLYILVGFVVSKMFPKTKIGTWF